jgi:hypothetical protein
LSLENPSPFPYTVSTPNEKYWENEDYYAHVPLISNNTHVIAFNILQEEYMHIWSVASIHDTRTFRMHMQARESGAVISYILWEIKTTSWLDAVERWHQEFPEIYNNQSAGWGFWATFANLTHVFPDSNEETEVFQVAFQWGADNKKLTVPIWSYVEPTLLHVPIPFNESTFMKDLEACKNKPSSGDVAVRCRVILSSASKLSNGRLICF